MNHFKCTLLIALLLGLTACQQSTSTPIETPSSFIEPPTASYKHPCATFQLSVPAKVKRDETANFIMTVKNICDQTIELGLGVKPYDILLAQEDGTVIWTWPPPDGDSGAILITETLEPQEEFVYAQEWLVEDNDEKPVASGTYQVLAALNVEIDKPGGQISESRQIWSKVKLINVVP